MVLINPGSGPVPTSGEGWTNTYEGAYGWATYWLGLIHEQAATDVVLLNPGTPSGDGRWTFRFRHPVTGVEVELVTHGIPFEQIPAYEKERLFAPRIYWNGSSCSEPVLQDWAADGFRAVRTFVEESA